MLPYSHVLYCTCLSFQPSEHALWNTMNTCFFEVVKQESSCFGHVRTVTQIKPTCSCSDGTFIQMLISQQTPNQSVKQHSNALVDRIWLKFAFGRNYGFSPVFHTSLSFFHFHFQCTVSNSILHDACSHETRDLPREIWSLLSGECKTLLNTKWKRCLMYLFLLEFLCTVEVKSLHAPCRICKMLIILPNKRYHTKCMLLFI